MLVGMLVMVADAVGDGGGLGVEVSSAGKLHPARISTSIMKKAFRIACFSVPGKFGQRP